MKVMRDFEISSPIDIAGNTKKRVAYYKNWAGQKEQVLEVDR